MMIIENEFNIGDTVFLITDPEQLPRLITRISTGPHDDISYGLMLSSEMSYHYAIEITKERQPVLIS